MVVRSRSYPKFMSNIFWARVSWVFSHNDKKKRKWLVGDWNDKDDINYDALSHEKKTALIFIFCHPFYLFFYLPSLFMFPPNNGSKITFISSISFTRFFL